MSITNVWLDIKKYGLGIYSHCYSKLPPLKSGTHNTLEPEQKYNINIQILL